MKVCRGESTLSHLLFIDDCFLFFREDYQEGMKIILNDCEQASGQTIKYAKYEVYFSIITPNDIREQLSNT
jgi:hypothetical protein